MVAVSSVELSVLVFRLSPPRDGNTVRGKNIGIENSEKKKPEGVRFERGKH